MPSPESDAPYRAVLGLMLEHLHIAVSNEDIVVDTEVFPAPAHLRAALATLMEEWVDVLPSGIPSDCGHPNHGSRDHDCKPFIPESEAPDSSPSRSERRDWEGQPHATRQRSENPYCMRCGRHLGLAFHETNEHDEARERADLHAAFDAVTCPTPSGSDGGVS